jgi:hypothetical protein
MYRCLVGRDGTPAADRERGFCVMRFDVIATRPPLRGCLPAKVVQRFGLILLAMPNPTATRSKSKLAIAVQLNTSTDEVSRQGSRLGAVLVPHHGTAAAHKPHQQWL